MARFLAACGALAAGRDISAQHSFFNGTGLDGRNPVGGYRIFYIHAADSEGEFFDVSPTPGKDPNDVFDVSVEFLYMTGRQANLRPEKETFLQQYVFGIWDRGDGSYMVRFSHQGYAHDATIKVALKTGKHLKGSPMTVAPWRSEACICPMPREEWRRNLSCTAQSWSIESDLFPFVQVTKDMLTAAIDTVDNIALMHYVVKNNRVYSKELGSAPGFRMFSDAMLLALARKVQLPDIEFLLNTGDFPQAKSSDYGPIFSWSKSTTDTWDVLLPTYIHTRRMMKQSVEDADYADAKCASYGRWEDKIPTAVWRGRDSNNMRIRLLEIASEHPDLIDAKVTEWRFRQDVEAKFGRGEDIEFTQLWRHKYLLNIDGTVAAYRLPALLAGQSVMFKQESEFTEHFYSELQPWEHYIPVKNDLSDLVEQIRWAQQHDNEAKIIGEQARQFMRTKLSMESVLCYHETLFRRYAERLDFNVTVPKDMVEVMQDSEPMKLPTPVGCDCDVTFGKDEL